jgi:large subunit ribosomal protein L17
MRHLKKTKKLKRTQEERLKLKIALASALVQSGKITTFTVRAKWFRPFFERLVTLVKRSGEDTQLAYRRLRPYLSEKDSRKMVEEIVPKLTERNGGYTRIYQVYTNFSNHDKSIVMITE